MINKLLSVFLIGLIIQVATQVATAESYWCHQLMTDRYYQDQLSSIKVGEVVNVFVPNKKRMLFEIVPATVIHLETLNDQSRSPFVIVKIDNNSELSRIEIINPNEAAELGKNKILFEEKECILNQDKTFIVEGLTYPEESQQLTHFWVGNKTKVFVGIKNQHYIQIRSLKKPGYGEDSISNVVTKKEIVEIAEADAKKYLELISEKQNKSSRCTKVSGSYSFMERSVGAIIGWYPYPKNETIKGCLDTRPAISNFEVSIVERMYPRLGPGKILDPKVLKTFPINAVEFD